MRTILYLGTKSRLFVLSYISTYPRYLEVIFFLEDAFVLLSKKADEQLGLAQEARYRNLLITTHASVV